jgi:hypothetical protein
MVARAKFAAELEPQEFKGEDIAMLKKSNWKVALVCFIALFGLVAVQTLSAEGGLVHMVSGVVKHADKDSKTMVVKATDGTEHTIKWTGDTTWEGAQESGKGIKEGSQVTVEYSEKAGEKTAVGVKDLGKNAAKAAQ